jgi:hypothetical protein
MIDHDASSYALIARVFDGQAFAAWEQPELLVADLRAAFKSLR